MKQSEKNQQGEMTKARLYHKCTANNCGTQSALHFFPRLYSIFNGINERQQIYILWRILFDTETTIASNARVAITTVQDCKKNLFALLKELYITGV